MGLMKKLYETLHPAPETKPAVKQEESDEVKAAMQRADSALIAVHEKAPAVTDLTSKLQDQLTRNHFAEMIEASMRPGV